MLICKNCFTENPDGTVKCIQCNMEGHFVYKIPEGKTLEIVTAEENTPQCTNCGSESPGDGEKCVHCNFPLPTARKVNGTTFHTHEFSKRKTG